MGRVSLALPGPLALLGPVLTDGPHGTFSTLG